MSIELILNVVAPLRKWKGIHAFVESNWNWLTFNLLNKCAFVEIWFVVCLQFFSLFLLVFFVFFSFSSLSMPAILRRILGNWAYFLLPFIKHTYVNIMQIFESFIFLWKIKYIIARCRCRCRCCCCYCIEGGGLCVTILNGKLRTQRTNCISRHVHMRCDDAPESRK